MGHTEIRIESTLSFFRHIRGSAGGVDHPVMSFESEEELARWLNKELGAVVVLRATDGFFVGYVPGQEGSHAEGTSMKEMAEKLVDLVSMLKQPDEKI